MTQVVLRICPACGATGKPHWEGDNPRPNTSNDGVMIRTCGVNWWHRRPCNCGRTLIYCYKCSNGVWQDPLAVPKAWLFFDPKETQL